MEHNSPEHENPYAQPVPRTCTYYGYGVQTRHLNVHGDSPYTMSRRTPLYGRPASIRTLPTPNDLDTAKTYKDVLKPQDGSEGIHCHVPVANFMFRRTVSSDLAIHAVRRPAISCSVSRLQVPEAADEQ